MRKFVRYGLVVVGMVAAVPVIGELILLFDTPDKYRWIGGTELTIEFVVTDAETGRPIPGAEVYLEAEYGGYVEGKERGLIVPTDAEGRVRRVLPNWTCCGSWSRWGLRRGTRGVRPVPWQVTCRAAGYQENEPFWLTDLPHRQNVRQVGPMKDLLVVPIALRKSAP